MNFSKFTLIIFVLSCLFLKKTNAQPSYCWAKPLVASGGIRFQDIASNPSNGDTYTAGYFSNDISAYFPTGINNTPDMSITYGGTDGLVAKYDSQGNEIWAFKIGGTTDDEVKGIAIDTFGNVYITGYFSGTADFTGVTTSPVLGAISSGGDDAFLAKYDNNGNLIWLKTISGTGEDWSNDITINSTGVFITGWFENSVTISGFSPIVSNDLKDVYTTAYNLNGTPRWLRQAGDIAGSPNEDRGISITADNNDVYVTGTFQGVLQFPDPPVVNLNTIDPNVSTIFIAEYDELTGTRTWEDIIGGDFDAQANGITVDVNFIYLTGMVEGFVGFPGGQLTATTGSGSEIFSCRINRSTTITDWIHLEENNVVNAAAANDIVVDSSNSIVYITGYFEGDTDFNGGLNSKTALGGQDVFIMARSDNGDFIWVETGGSGGGSNEQGMGISFDSLGGIYVSGWYEQGITFGPFSLPNGSQDNGFITKLNCNEACDAPPSISNAGPDQVLHGVNSTYLNGNTPVIGSGSWLNVSGNANILNLNDPISFVDNLDNGDNIFEWVVSNEFCADSRDEIIVTVMPLVVPNLFSPNDDGDNDFFIVSGLELLDNEVVIFNRWGVELYRNINYQNDWDGTDKSGKNLPDDTYFYVIKIADTTNEISGFIMLKR